LTLVSSVFTAGAFNFFESEKWILVGGVSSIATPQDYGYEISYIGDKIDAYTHYSSCPDLKLNVVELPGLVSVTVYSFVRELGIISNWIVLAKLFDCGGIGTVQGFLYL
jgi:hypothetical protein